MPDAKKVKVRCVQGNVVDYPLVLANIQLRGKTHRVKVVVNSHLRHPLILGTDWPAFTQLLGILCADAQGSRIFCHNKGQVVSGGPRLKDKRRYNPISSSKKLSGISFPGSSL